MDKLKYFPKPFRGDFIGDRKWKAVEPFVYHSDMVGTIIIPVDFITDGGSIPPILYSVIGPPWGKYAEICIIHDYLSVTKKFSRIITQKIFLEGLNILGVPFWKKPLMYVGVRIFSWFAWKKYASVTLVLVLLIGLSSCALTATKKINEIKLEGFPGGKAEFSDGTKIEKDGWKVPTFPFKFEQ